MPFFLDLIMSQKKVVFEKVLIVHLGVNNPEGGKSKAVKTHGLNF